MGIIKHISFDLYGTLIKSHPLYKTSRADEISRIILTESGLYFPPRDIINYIQEYKNILCNNQIATGFHKENFEETVSGMVKHIVSKEYNKLYHINFENTIYRTIDALNKLAELYPVKPLYTDIPEILGNIKRRTNVSFSILSNTGLIPGKHINIGLFECGIKNLMDFILYSDEIGLTKPNQKAFKLISDNSNLKPQEILFVGDRRNINGKCQLSNMAYYHIDNKITSLRTLNYILSK